MVFITGVRVLGLLFKDWWDGGGIVVGLFLFLDGMRRITRFRRLEQSSYLMSCTYLYLSSIAVED